MASNGLSNLCDSTTYVSAFDILSVADFPLGASERLVSLFGQASPNITISTASHSSIDFSKYTYSLLTSLPLTKPLLVECPLSVCVFPVSGYFVFPQRLLFYANMIVAAAALQIPILRGIAQIWLTTFWFSAVALCGVTLLSTSRPEIYNLDLPPAILVVHTAIVPTLIWFAFRAEQSKPLSATKHRLGSSLYLHPITRILVPLYTIWSLMEVIVANTAENPMHEFWPSVTAVIVENDNNFLLTSPCFESPSGQVLLWGIPKTAYNAVRKLADLSIYYPPPGTAPSDVLRVLPVMDITIMHIGSIPLCLMIISLSFKSLSSLKRWLSGGKLAIQPSKARYVAILPFAILMVLASALTIYLITIYEYKSHLQLVPESEFWFEIGQWGSWLTATLIILATLIARKLDLEFEETEQKGFKWVWDQWVKQSQGANYRAVAGERKSADGEDAEEMKVRLTTGAGAMGNNSAGKPAPGIVDYGTGAPQLSPREYSVDTGLWDAIYIPKRMSQQLV